MRATILMSAVACLSSVGCSSLIEHGGTNISALATRAQVREAFGEPISANAQDGDSVEEFDTHRKIARPGEFHGLPPKYSLTLGLGEFIWFPEELCIAARRSIVGQRLQFTYDADGHVIYIRHDGEPVERHPYLTTLNPF